MKYPEFLLKCFIEVSYIYKKKKKDLDLIQNIKYLGIYAGIKKNDMTDIDIKKYKK